MLIEKPMKRIIIYLITIICSASLSAQTDTCLINSEIGISFPPVADAVQRDFAKTHLDSLGIKKIRFAENWALREPAPGVFNWTPLDERISWAVANNYEILLTIQSDGPNWACGLQNPQSCVFNDNNDFKNYIDSLLLRYPNQIDKIQFGNEWQSDFWYVGNAQEFVEANNVLYNSVQTNSPTTEVVLGGFTTISLRFFAGCNGDVESFYDDDGVLYDSTFLADNCTSTAIVEVNNRIDSVLSYASYQILDIHLYDDAEQWDEYYSNFSDTIAKPIIVSEFGGPNMNLEPYSEAYQANRLFQYVKKLDSIGISEIYYFKLVEGTANPAHSTSGLIEDTTLIAKPAYSVIKSFIECTSLGFEYDDDIEKQIKLYPNPAKNWISLEFENPFNTSVELQIFSANGQLVFEKSGISDNLFFLKTVDFESGLYFIQVKSDYEIIGNGKLIIQK
jgi:hypothetical protein